MASNAHFAVAENVDHDMLQSVTPQDVHDDLETDSHESDEDKDMTLTMLIK